MREGKKLIVADCDGTLLRSDYSLSEETVSFISSLKERGILFVLASGRPPRAMLPHYEELKLETPIICYNGALVYSPFDPNYKIEKRPFCRDEVLEICAKAAPFLLGVQIEEGENIYCLDDDPGLDSYFWKKGMNVRFGNVSRLLDKDPFSVVFKCAEEDDWKLEAIVNGYHPLSWRHWTGSLYSELYYPDANKGSGLRSIMKHYGVKKEDCYAFGDSLNDREMLLEAGHPFVMKSSKAKALFDEFPATSKSNDEDGVLFELKRLGF